MTSHSPISQALTVVAGLLQGWLPSVVSAALGHVTPSVMHCIAFRDAI
jgi:uncharacterized protein (DUF2342 family)